MLTDLSSRVTTTDANSGRYGQPDENQVDLANVLLTTAVDAWRRPPQPDLPDAEGGDAAVVRPGTRLWHRHPAVRARELTFGEKAADWLKHWFLGTWIALGLVTVWIAVWIALQRTSLSWDLYPFILLNLCLSCLAAIQGIILQISANRGDKVNAVIALHTEDNTDKLAVIAQHNVENTNKLATQTDQLLDLQRQQLDMLKSLTGIQVAIDGIQARLADGPED